MAATSKIDGVLIRANLSVFLQRANANHGIGYTTVVHCVPDCIRDRIRLAVPEPPEWQRAGNEIEAEWIPTDERYSLLTLIATTESVSSCVRMNS